jgi:hypothetical protein
MTPSRSRGCSPLSTLEESGRPATLPALPSQKSPLARRHTTGQALGCRRRACNGGTKMSQQRGRLAAGVLTAGSAGQWGPALVDAAIVYEWLGPAPSRPSAATPAAEMAGSSRCCQSGAARRCGRVTACAAVRAAGGNRGRAVAAGTVTITLVDVGRYCRIIKARSGSRQERRRGALHRRTGSHCRQRCWVAGHTLDGAHGSEREGRLPDRVRDGVLHGKRVRRRHGQGGASAGDASSRC